MSDHDCTCSHGVHLREDCDECERSAAYAQGRAAAPSLLNACVVAERFLAPREADAPDSLSRVLSTLRAAIADAKAFP